MPAQSALALYFISDVAENTLSILREEDPVTHKANLLTRRYSERASRSQNRIQGVGGSTIYLAEVDPVLTIDISGWVLSRGGLANLHPGTLINGSVVANWRNGATKGRTEADRRAGLYPSGTVDHFGWDVLDGWDGLKADGINFIVRDPVFTRSPGGLSEVSLQLVLECTGGKGGASKPVDNGGDPPPDITTVYRIVTVYTDKGTYQMMTIKENPTKDDLFGSSAGSWDELTHHRPVTGIKHQYSDGMEPFNGPANVLGVNIQAPSGYGSDPGGAWLAGSEGEVTGGGIVIKNGGPDIWIMVFGDGYEISRNTCDLVAGPYSDIAAVLAAYDPPKVEADFARMYKQGSGWLYNPDPPDPQGNPLDAFGLGV